MQVSIPDLINAAFEAGSGIAVVFSIAKLWRDKLVRGYSIWTVLFFNIFGMWNTFFYSHLHQWLSLVGGLTLATTNTILTLSMAYFIWREKNHGTQS